MELPITLNRDELWAADAATMQLEFVVDNELLARLANLEARCANESYKPVVQRIRSRIRKLMSHFFSYKAGFLQLVDWRPREFNEAADLIADRVLNERRHVRNLDLHHIGNRLRDFVALQIYSDGGYANGRGSMAFVIIGWYFEAGGMHRTILGYDGMYVTDSKSSFCNEIGALDLATSAAEFLAKWLPRKADDIAANMVRHQAI